jgi:hypothetical protein
LEWRWQGVTTRPTVSKLKPAKDEAPEAFTVRVIEKINSLDDDDRFWKSLSKDSQSWFNDCVDVIENKVQ